MCYQWNNTAWIGDGRPSLSITNRLDGHFSGSVYQQFVPFRCWDRVWMHPALSKPSSAEGHLGCFQFGANTNEVVMNIGVWMVEKYNCEVEWQLHDPFFEETTRPCASGSTILIATCKV